MRLHDSQSGNLELTPWGLLLAAFAPVLVPEKGIAEPSVTKLG